MSSAKKDIVNYSDFDVSKIVFGEVTKSAKGGKSIPIMYMYDKGPRSFMLITPEIMTWGAKLYPKKTPTEDDVWSMNLPLGRGVPEEFISCIRELDKKVKDFLQVNSKAIFGSVKTQEIINEIFMEGERPIVDPITGQPTNTFLKIKLPNFDGKWNFAVFKNDDSQTKLFPVSDSQTPDSVILKKSQVQILLSINSLWIAGGKVGYTLKALQISVGNAEPSLMDVSVFPKKAVRSSAASTEVCDSDEEEAFGLSSESVF